MSIDKRYVVGEDKEGVCVEVGPWPEVPGFIAIEITQPKSKAWFGNLNGAAMSPQFARDLGQALIQAAKDAEEAK